MTLTRRQTLAGLGAATAAAALGTPARAQQGPLGIGFVYVGPPGDFGWTHQHDLARKHLEATFGDKVKTSFVERVAVADSERVIEQLARAGNRLILTTSFGYMDPTVRVAGRFPDVRFEHATGFKRAANLATYSARFYEGRFVNGQIAARVSKSGTIGYLAGFPIPEVVAGINAFMLGAWSQKPDMKVKIIYVNSWFDPGKEADAARALIDQGCDVLTQHTDSAAPLQIAQERGVFGFGQASDMTRFAPKAHLSSIVNNWNDYYVARVRAVMDGTWSSTDTWGGLDSGMVRMAPFTNMPAEVTAMASATVEDIKSKRRHPFAGPLTRQDGTAVIAAGQTLTDDQIRGINYYLRGIEDRLPNT